MCCACAHVYCVLNVHVCPILCVHAFMRACVCVCACGRYVDVHMWFHENLMAVGWMLHTCTGKLSSSLQHSSWLWCTFHTQAPLLNQHFSVQMETALLQFWMQNCLRDSARHLVRREGGNTHWQKRAMSSSIVWTHLASYVIRYLLRYDYVSEQWYPLNSIYFGLQSLMTALLLWKHHNIQVFSLPFLPFPSSLPVSNDGFVHCCCVDVQPYHCHCAPHKPQGATTIYLAAFLLKCASGTCSGGTGFAAFHHQRLDWHKWEGGMSTIRTVYIFPLTHVANRILVQDIETCTFSLSLTMKCVSSDLARLMKSFKAQTFIWG